MYVFVLFQLSTTWLNSTVKVSAPRLQHLHQDLLHISSFYFKVPQFFYFSYLYADKRKNKNNWKIRGNGPSNCGYLKIWPLMTFLDPIFQCEILLYYKNVNSHLSSENSIFKIDSTQSANFKDTGISALFLLYHPLYL